MSKKIFICGEEIKSKLLSCDKWLKDSDSVLNDANGTQFRVWAAKNVKPLDAPTNIGRYAIYIRINVANWIPIQIAFDVTSKGFWITKMTDGKWNPWEQMGGTK